MNPLAERLGALVLRAAQTSTRVLGLDPGTRFVGLALSSADLRVAMPLRVLDRATVCVTPPATSPLQAHAEALHAIIASQRVSALVVGLPLDSLGQEGEACVKVRRYVKQLKLASLPVVFIDERYTTSASRHAFKSIGLSVARQQQAKDTSAATIILQNALDIGFLRPAPASKR
mmetsp:Transcript_12908/g.32720  ORF Transcript_12908/g.32720 Transcript_12908/m.32720 type:complete len:174 (+) Transcript_12908:28-549(+)